MPAPLEKSDAPPAPAATPLQPTAAAAPPAAAAAPAPVADKPIEELPREPLTYNVNGQKATFDGGFIIPGHGAVITADALPKLQDRLQQADRLVAQNQQLYRQVQQHEKLGGTAAYEKLQGEKALLDASAVLLLRALTDENTLIALATDPVARQQLLKELDLTSREAQWKAQASFRESGAQEQQAETSARNTQTAIHNAVGHLAQEFPGLTAEDINAVRAHAGRLHTAIVRPATPAEAREANVQPGAPVIDLPALHSLLADRHELRKQAAVAAQRRQTDTLENAARAAAAAPTTASQNGKTPASRPGAGKAPAAPARKPIDQMSSQELTRAMKSGRIFEMLGDDDQ